MTRPAPTLPLLVLLLMLSIVSLAWSGRYALLTSKDLMYRAAEVDRFARGDDPYPLESMTYPPPALAVFAPLIAPFGSGTVRAFWLVLNLLALGGLGWAVVALWGGRWPAWLKAAFVLGLAASKPVRIGIGLGQFHLIPMALMLLSVVALRRRRPILAGLLVGIALAKPTMALPMLGLLVLRREWRSLAAAAGVQGIGLLIVSAWLGIGPLILVREWIANARGQLGEGSIDLPTLASRLGLIPPSAGAGLALTVLAVGFGALIAARRASDASLTGFAAFAAAIFTYHRHYDLVLLAAPLASCVEAAFHSASRPAAIGRGLAAALFGVVLIAPNNPILSGRIGDWYDAALIPSAYAFLTLIVLDLAREAVWPGWMAPAGADRASGSFAPHTQPAQGRGVVSREH